MRKPEIVYLGHSNVIDRILKSKRPGEAMAAVDLSSVVKMTLTLGDLTLESTNQEDDPIRWAQEGYETGQIRIFLGGQDIKPGDYDAPLVVYDEGDEEGIVWGEDPYIEITVVAEVEAAGPE